MSLATTKQHLASIAVATGCRFVSTALELAAGSLMSDPAYDRHHIDAAEMELRAECPTLPQLTRFAS